MGVFHVFKIVQKVPNRAASYMNSVTDKILLYENPIRSVFFGYFDFF